jgi:hypothetical protein
VRGEYSKPIKRAPVSPCARLRPYTVLPAPLAGGRGANRIVARRRHSGGSAVYTARRLEGVMLGRQRLRPRSYADGRGPTDRRRFRRLGRVLSIVLLLAAVAVIAYAINIGQPVP